MRRLLPPTHLLRAFIATAQLGSIARAAESLHLTPSAVSKQIGELERWVALSLFERERKRLLLTDAGQRYLDALVPILHQLEAATFELMRNAVGGSGVLHISVLPTLGDSWLMPHLPRFNAKHPDIDLRFSPYLQGEEDLAEASLDCTIRYGSGNWPDDMQSDYLGGREVVVIAPPDALRHHPLRTMDDLRHYTLFHHIMTPHAWAVWMKIHGVEGVNALSGPQRTLASSVISAVSTGEGVAIIPECLVRGEVARGELTIPFPPFVHTDGYYLCYPVASLGHAAFQTFRTWLLELAESTLKPPAAPSS
jgi:LysR family transcriptional regulator, glycine cleavage system transcriptional activator